MMINTLYAYLISVSGMPHMGDTVHNVIITSSKQRPTEILAAIEISGLSDVITPNTFKRLTQEGEQFCGAIFRGKFIGEGDLSVTIDGRIKTVTI